MAENSGGQGHSTSVNEDGGGSMSKPREDLVSSENSDDESINFELSGEENYLLSYFPSELDFYDHKRGKTLRRNGGKKLSVKVRATMGCPHADQEVRIKKRVENIRKKKEDKRKAKEFARISKERAEARAGGKGDTPVPTIYLTKSVQKTSNESINQATKPPSFYNNSDFVLGSGNSVKFDDQAFMNLLIELQNREITPEDYDLLVQLDCSVKPKTLSEAQIDSLKSDTVTCTLDDTCSICIEDYTPGEVRKFLPCGHYFHGQCIKTWLSWTSNRCPIDGKEVR